MQNKISQQQMSNENMYSQTKRNELWNYIKLYYPDHNLQYKSSKKDDFINFIVDQEQKEAEQELQDLFNIIPPETPISEIDIIRKKHGPSFVD